MIRRIKKTFHMALLPLFFCFPNANAEKAPLPAQMLIQVYQEPSAMKADNKHFLVYEIYLTNYMKSISTLQSFLIEDGNKNKLLSLDELKNAIQSRSTEKKDNILSFAPGETKTVFVWIPRIGEGAVPKHIIHHLSLDSNFKDKPYTFDSGPYAIGVNPAQPIIIEAPLKGKNWLAGNGPSNSSDHRTTAMIIDGQPYYAQRYAIDFVQMGEDGKSYTGDVHKNSSYHCYNQDLLAVADGTVVQLQDGLPENVPNSNQFALPITEKNLPGNYLVIQIGKGAYAGYAHIIPGSFKVRVGDRVRKNQVLAKLGNSGNSSEPHLHFQIIDQASFLKSNGIPYGFAHFYARPSQLATSASGSVEIKKSDEKFKKFSRQLVLENALMNFD